MRVRGGAFDASENPLKVGPVKRERKLCLPSCCSFCSRRTAHVVRMKGSSCNVLFNSSARVNYINFT